jgi:ribosomal protein S18 acetylase RimI-like enzyme
MTDDDLAFVGALYASTREHEFAPLGWPAEQLRSFLAQQHELQHLHYRSHYPEADSLILEQAGEPVGRLYIEQRADALHLIDLALMPQLRGRGIGGAILADLIAAARAAGRKVSLQVVHHNPARRLYERLGFRTVEDVGAYLRMEWDGGAAPAQ